jgi:hypothetical protein
MPLAHHTTRHRRRASPLVVLETIDQIEHRGRTYQLLRVATQAGQEYLCLRLYNAEGRFIANGTCRKQFLIEPELDAWLIYALGRASASA